jgi:hypothetical protein
LYSLRAPSVIITTESASTASTFPASFYIYWVLGVETLI